jgi:hypothetical protein
MLVSGHVVAAAQRAIMSVARASRVSGSAEARKVLDRIAAAATADQMSIRTSAFVDSCV